MKRIGSHFGLNLVLSLGLLALFCSFWQAAPPTARGIALAQSGNLVDRQVTQSSDDAEEAVQSGVMSLTSSDLEFVTDPNGAIEQLVGIRFTDIDIPAGAKVISASIEFTVDETGAEPTSVTIYGEATDDAVTFTLDASNISQRLRTDSAILWGEIDPWTAINDTVQTPDLSIILQEIVDRPGWQAQNALAFIFSGSGWRTAVAFEGNAANAPRLHIVWQSLPTATPTAIATDSPTPTLATATPTPTVSLTETTTPTDTATASPTTTNTATTSASPSTTTTPTPSATATHAVTLAPTATLTPTATATALPSATTTATPTITATLPPTPMPTPDPRCSRTGAALRSLWFHMEGSLIEDIVRNARFPDQPDQVQLLNQLETAPNLDDDYADRIQGYLCPPQSAEYTFWIAGDDQSQLWLSSDNTPTKTQLIASVSDWTYYQEWDKFAEQRSEPILLTANQAYYFEILHKESINDDNLSVAWQAASFGRQVISGRYLVPYADNLPPPENKLYLPLVSH